MIFGIMFQKRMNFCEVQIEVIMLLLINFINL